MLMGHAVAAELRWRVVDLGAKAGKAATMFLKTGREHFGGTVSRILPRECLCIERNLHYEAEVKRRGHAFWCVDVEALATDEYPIADYYVAWNFLEHLRSRDASKAVLARMLGAASCGVSLLLPSFEQEPQLDRAGLAFVWTRWSGHPSHFLVEDVAEVVELTPGWVSNVRRGGAVESSKSELLVPTLADDIWDKQRYDPKMGLKPLVMFDPLVATRWYVDIRRVR
jgi:hypothetical protein